MGITGLLPLVKNASTKMNIKDIPGENVAVDVSCWLHSAASVYTLDIISADDYSNIVNYCVKRILLIEKCGKRPIVVFDGARLPGKESTNSARQSGRVKAFENGCSYMISGDNHSAKKEFQKSISITFEMKQAVINELRRRGVDYLISPYEADAQIARLVHSNLADIVVTQDSDLIVYKCDKILFKMDSKGDGVVFDSSKLPNCFDGWNTEVSFMAFRRMCILSGCDYLPSIRGIGLKRAQKAFFNSRNLTVAHALRRLKIRTVPDGYIENFLRAEQIFLLQIVYDVRTGVQVPLGPYATNEEFEASAGEILQPEISFQLAIGNIDPENKDMLVGNYDVTTGKYSTGSSIWSQLSQSRQNSGTTAVWPSPNAKRPKFDK